jgi:hypothetical protein
VPSGTIYAGAPLAPQGTVPPMTDIITKPITKDEIKVKRPRLHKVILINDDFTPREFVVMVLKSEFRISFHRTTRPAVNETRAILSRPPTERSVVVMV